MKTNSNKQLIQNLAKCLNQDLSFNKAGKISTRKTSHKPSNHSLPSTKHKTKTNSMKANINKNKA